MNLQTIILWIDLAVSLGISVAAFTRARLPGGRSLGLLALFSAAWSLCDLLLPAAASGPWHWLLAAAFYLTSTLAAAALFSYMVWLSDREHWITRLPWGLLAVMPLVTLALFLVPPWHDVLFGAAEQRSAMLLFLDGAWSRIVALYVYSLIGSGAVLLWNTYLERPRMKFLPLGGVLVGSLFPLLAASLEFAGLAPFSPGELLPIGFTLASAAFAYHFFQGVSGPTPFIDRNAAIEGMDDGWMVLDAHNVIVDLNSTAERMAGLNRSQVIGKPLQGVVGNLPSLGQALNQSQELEMKRSIRSEEGWKYLTIRLSPLYDRNRKPFGRLALWHDVTQAKLAEDARQRARDEMLVLLNAISSTASNVLDLEEFLSESIYHIIFPFRSQLVAFFLVAEKKKDDWRFVLTAHLGMSEQAAEDMAALPVSSPLFDSILAERQVIQVDRVESDGRVPAPLRAMGLTGLLLLPLVNQTGGDTQVLGCMMLARKEGPVYSPDEIVRLGMIAERVASLIDSDRRRTLAITTSERQRMTRDLHDSVTQKLYALVNHTEAAQAALEVGAVDNLGETLAKLGDQARQALKEMRLFLFELQPIDMERDGLVSLLHRRLSAVEGRANVKAAMRSDLTDDEIALSSETELMLYQVAHEALNNILKHAAAQTVLVTLKQGTRNVILEIKDDGCGFDSKKVDRGGLGLNSMRQRTALMHGKLQMVTRPGKGTRVVVTVPKDPSFKRARRRR